MTPKRLLLLDFGGALTTALTTGFLLATSIIPTGLPVWILGCMSITAAGFAGFGILSYCYATEPRQPLAILAVLNLIYCGTAIISCLVYWPLITIFGILYFGLESIIVVPLAILELVTAGRTLKSAS
jgi:hypothetical protein